MVDFITEVLANFLVFMAFIVITIVIGLVAVGTIVLLVLAFREGIIVGSCYIVFLVFLFSVGVAIKERYW